MDKKEMDELLRMISAVLHQNQAINMEVKKLLLQKPMHDSDMKELKKLLKENQNTLSILRDRIPI
ncbi:hypothetical protein D1Z97_03815 [Riemerella anatipestifer]|uniref:hypothetical protein n=1 Tax=Riemerella anatipestifer TaxID=34085 RepID=UPI00129E3CF4|nr:hypothetical protein [Riemerella anatipestifer]MDY3547054.1 hypothetical protein [Riemerella anatipestifer]MRN00329.1 hypothetical protein [Riemerella anatipestifer]MRN02661.1 hypothetical protein [Riemerella anatipestifer]USL96290.1 hypothetical protein D1J36_004090 [Riemerella anatipestifer]